MAESVGHWLVENKYRPGTRAAIFADNHPRWVTAYLGIIAAGCTAVPLDTAFHADQVAKLLKDSGSSLVFCDQKHLKLVQEAVTGLQVGMVLLGGDQRDRLRGQVAGDLDSIIAAGPAFVRSRSRCLPTALPACSTPRAPPPIPRA